MRKLLVYIVLLMHVNTYMFFPMVDETDVYEANGTRRDDINSLAEFINQILLGHRDSTPEDEDDDQAHYYHINSAHRYVVTQYIAQPPVSRFTPEYSLKPYYGALPVQKLATVAYDVAAPPPQV